MKRIILFTLLFLTAAVAQAADKKYNVVFSDGSTTLVKVQSEGGKCGVYREDGGIGWTASGKVSDCNDKSAVAAAVSASKGKKVDRIMDF